MTKVEWDEIHEDYAEHLATLNRKMAVLNNNIDWVVRIGRWAIATMVTVAIVVTGAVGTYMWRASDVYAQVQKNTQAIHYVLEHEKKEEEVLKSEGRWP